MTPEQCFGDRIGEGVAVAIPNNLNGEFPRTEVREPLLQVFNFCLALEPGELLSLDEALFGG